MKEGILKLILLILAVVPTLVIAQKQSIITVGVSGNSYNGELSSYSSWSSGLQIGWIFSPNKRLSGSLSAGLASVTGEDGDFTFQTNIGDPAPNTFVKTNYFYAHYALRFTFLRKGNVSAYLSQGLGFMRFTPKDEFDEELEDQDDTRNQDETYRNISFMIPTSIGASYTFTNGFGINLELGLLNSTSDYLDNISELGSSGSDNVLATRLALAIPFNR
ncbi:MAG: outer membrane beta-barrel protein [Bacteroidota bacterium]